MTPLGRLFSGASALCLSTCLSCAAWAERYALVLGVDDYAVIEDASGAAQDAANVATALTNLDFEVTVLTDPSHDALDAMLTAFAARLTDANTVVIYFAGHALQFGGQNYLLSADARLDNITRLGEESWTVDEILAQVNRRESHQTIILLDSSRALETDLADGPGLAAMRPGKGVFLASAAQSGKLAQPATEGDRSVFAAGLLAHLETEGISLSDMMARVRGEVARLTDEAQIPWARSNLTAQVYLNPVVENGTVITAADLEAWGALDDNSRDRLLAALGRNGVLLEIIEVDETEETTEVASLEPEIGEIGLVIEDVDDDIAPIQAAASVTEGQDSQTPAVTGQAPSGDAVQGSQAVASLNPDTQTGTETQADPATQTEGVATQTGVGAGPELAEAAVEIPENLPKAIQEELTRVGCHRSVIDGLWGRVSTVSLLRYYAGRGELTEEQAKGRPTEAAFLMLKAEEGVVCEGVIAPTVRTASAATTRKVTKPKATKVVVRRSTTGASSGSSNTRSSSGTTPRIQSRITRTESGETKVTPKISSGVFR